MKTDGGSVSPLKQRKTSGQKVQKQISSFLSEDSVQWLIALFPNARVFTVEEDFTLSTLDGKPISGSRPSAYTYILGEDQDISKVDRDPYHQQLVNGFSGVSSTREPTYKGRNYRVNCYPIKSKNRVERVLVVVEDLTDQKIMKQAIDRKMIVFEKNLVESEEIEFSELFDLEEIQKIQDAFSNATGVASIITHPDGTPITRPTNFCRLCIDIIRKTPLGMRNCYLSDAIIGRHHPGGPVVQPCLSGGLWDAGASITVGGKHIANWLIGQVRDETQSEDKIRDYARQIEVDEEVAVAAFNETTKMSRSQFEEISQALFLVAGTLSTLAYQNLQQARFIDERSRAELALSESESKYSSYVNNSPNAVLLADLDGVVLDANPAAARLTGYQSSDLKGMSLLEFTHPMDLHEAKSLLNQVRTHNKDSREIRIKKKSGQIRWWNVDTVTLTPNTFLMYANDITSRKLAEEEIIRKNIEVNTFFTTSLDMLSIVDRSGKFRRVNPEWTHTTGYEADELIGRKFLDFVHPDDVEATQRVFKDLVDKNPILNFTNRYICKDGTFRWIEWRSMPFGDYIYASARDITQRIQAEADLSTSLNRFQSLFSSMTEGCGIHELVFDEQGQPINYILKNVNPSYEKILNVPANQVIGQLATDVYHVEEPPYLNIFSQVAITGEPYHFSTYFAPINIHFDISVSSPQKNHFVTLFTNINDRVRWEDEIRKLNTSLEEKVKERTHQLEAANKEMEAFTYSVSHDLRAPLRSIDGFSQILLEDFNDILTEEGRHYLNHIRKATQNMGTLIDDLLRLSRIMRAELRITQTNLSEIASKLFENLWLEDPDRNVDVTVQPNMLASCDQNLTRIALENLIRNAWKFSRKKDNPRIEVGCVDEGNRKVYFVRDNGAGFDMAYVNKLFGAFQRLHSDDEFEGSGIGLAIVERIIQRHGGEVWAEGAIDQGATFWFTLPEGGAVWERK